MNKYILLKIDTNVLINCRLVDYDISFSSYYLKNIKVTFVPFCVLLAIKQKKVNIFFDNLIFYFKDTHNSNFKNKQNVFCTYFFTCLLSSENKVSNTP